MKSNYFMWFAVYWLLSNMIRLILQETMGWEYDWQSSLFGQLRLIGYMIIIDKYLESKEKK